MESGNYFGVNAVGSHIWEALETESSIETIIKAVTSQFEVSDGDSVQGDVLAFLGDMVEQQLVEVVNQ